MNCEYRRGRGGGGGKGDDSVTSKINFLMTQPPITVTGHGPNIGAEHKLIADIIEDNVTPKIFPNDSSTTHHRHWT